MRKRILIVMLVLLLSLTACGIASLEDVQDDIISRTVACNLQSSPFIEKKLVNSS